MGLEHHITTTSKPDDEITDSSRTKTKNPNAVQWILNDGLLTSWLLGNMKEETLSMILGGDTSYFIWSSLHEQLLLNTEDCEAQLKNSLYAITKGSLSLDDYIRKFKELCDKLSAIGKPVSDVDKVFQIFKGLGNKYKDFRIAVLSKPPYPSFNQFIMSLQNFEHVYLSEEKSPIDHNQAFLGQRGRGRNMHGGRGNFRGRGSYSYMPNRPTDNNHASNSTTLPKYNNNWREPPRQHNKEPCQICGRTNHTAPKCYYRYEYNTENENTQQALAALTINEESDPNFYVDSGATTHMTNKGGNLISKPYFGTDTVFVGNGQSLPITHTGKALLKTTQGKLHLNNVLVVPKLKKNLLSVSQLIDDNSCTFEFNKNGFVIKDQTHQILAKGHKKGSLYALEGGKIEALATVKEASSEVWHARLGHPNFKFLQILENKKVINVSDWLIKNTLCSSCQLGKRCKLSFNKSDSFSKFPLEKIHSDLWGPTPILSSQKFQFYVIFVDDYTRYTWLYPLKNKSNFYTCFLKFQALVENHFDRKIKIFQSDGGGEFTSKEFSNHLAYCGISQQLSCPFTPEQNGLAERKHRHIVETGITLLFHAHVPLKFWVDAFLTAVYLINRLPLSSTGKETPYSKLFGKNPDYSGIRIFGSQCFPYLKTPALHKFSRKTISCVFIGYSPLHKGYRCLDPQTHRVYISRHVVFNEKHFPYSPQNNQITTSSDDSSITTFPEFDEWFSERKKDGNSIHEDPLDDSPKHLDFDLLDTPQPSLAPSAPVSTPTQDQKPNNNNLPIQPPKRSNRDRHPPSYLKDYLCPTIPNLSPSHNALMVSIEELKTYKTALKYSNWQAAMQEEINAFHSNNTWTLVPRPLDANVVGSKWVFRTKLKED